MVRRSRPSVKYSIHAPTRRAGYRRDRYAASAWPTGRVASRSAAINESRIGEASPARQASSRSSRRSAPGASTEIGRNTTSPRGSRAPARLAAGPRRNRRPPAPPPSPAAALPAPRAARSLPPGTATPAGHESPDRARRRHERIFPERGQFHHIAFRPEAGKAISTGSLSRVSKCRLGALTPGWRMRPMSARPSSSASTCSRVVASRSVNDTAGCARGNAATRAAAIHREKY